MDDPARMRRIQRVGDLNGNRESAAQIQGPSADQFADVLPLDILHRDKVNALDVVQIENGADIRVIKRRGQTRLALEPFEVGFFDS